ncbi:MAG: hypothetical protein Q8R48_00570, partial [Candidatus Omnitrophota bacterium]|nr:hypothetical protein [Candidatus Omnitrophota bacterium]
GGRIPTANRACESAVLTLADMLINDINESIKSEDYEETTVQIVLANADYAKVKALAKALDEQRSIKLVSERSLELNVAIIDVELLGSADSLAELLITMQNGPVLRVTGKTQNRIDAEFIESAALQAIVADKKTKEVGKDGRGTFSSMYLTRLE